jgi:hypothetical protein
MNLSGAYSSLSDSELDNAYAATYAAKDSPTYTNIALEIVQRNASKSGFLFNLLGSPFPQYDAIQASQGGFVASEAAPQTIVTSAGKVGTSIVDTAASIGKYGVVGLVAVAAIVAMFYFRKK